MAGVFIDVPGVGTVEAKNAATESTLRELVNIMKGNLKEAVVVVAVAAQVAFYLVLAALLPKADLP